MLLTWNSERYLSTCLACLETSMSALPWSYEVLILDNGSIDGTSDMLREFASANPGKTTVLFEKENTGTTISRNRLLRHSRGRLVCIMDSDVEINEAAMRKLVPLLEADSNIGIVVPRINYPSGRWQKSYDDFPSLQSKVNRFFRLRVIERREGEGADLLQDPFPVDYAISAFWLMRRELFDLVGYLDENIFYAPEDADFCLRVWGQGLQVVYVPSVHIVHHTQEISRGIKLNRAKFSHLRGLAYYFLKHRYLFRKPRPRKSQ